MTRVIHPSALEDLEAAVVFYEKQSAGLGAEVYVDLLQEIGRACEFAGSHRKVDRFFRYVTCGRFPHFCIYYTIETEVVHIRAVLDHRQDPRTIRRRLREV